MSVLTPRLFLILVWPLPISLATTLGISFDFSSSPYLDVSVREVPFLNLCIQLRIHSSSLWGFPHSEIRGSMDISSSPRLIAGYRVLHRLSVPRHSPYALFRLNSRFAFLHNFSIRKQIQLFCLSFANNCFGLWTEYRVSDYSKDLNWFYNSRFLSTWGIYLLPFGRNCFGVFSTPPTCLRKNL